MVISDCESEEKNGTWQKKFWPGKSKTILPPVECIGSVCAELGCGLECPCLNWITHRGTSRMVRAGRVLCLKHSRTVKSGLSSRLICPPAACFARQGSEKPRRCLPNFPLSLEALKGSPDSVKTRVFEQIDNGQTRLPFRPCRRGRVAGNGTRCIRQAPIDGCGGGNA